MDRPRVVRDARGNEWTPDSAWLQDGNGSKPVTPYVYSAARDRLMRASAAARATRGLVLFLLAICGLFALWSALR